MHRDAAQCRTLLDGVARRARDRRDDGALHAEQSVQQAGLADVGTPDQRHTQPLAQDAPLRGAGEQSLDLVARTRDEAGQLGGIGRRDLLLGKVDAGLYPYQRGQSVRPRGTHSRREVALQLAHRQPPPGIRLGGDERHDRLSLRQIDAPVQEGA